MKNFLLFCFLMMSGLVAAQTTIHCWDFNNGTSGTDGNEWPSPVTLSARVTGLGTITHDFVQSSNHGVESFAGNVGNACQGSLAGGSFCPQGAGTTPLNNGRSFTLNFPTEGFEDIVLSFWCRRTGTGFNDNIVEYTTDGTFFTLLEVFEPINDSEGSVLIFDFSSISAANDNADFAVRITLDGATGSNGNNRYDNIKLEGTPTSLPITLLSFTAERQGRTAFISWTSSAEEDNDYMAVERSQDGRNFREIGRVSGAGTTDREQHYHFIDQQPFPGMNYYRLRQVDFDGTFEHHRIASLDFRSGEGSAAIQVYPNPTKGDLFFGAPLAEDAELLLLNAQGQLLQQLHADQTKAQNSLSTASLPAGIYFLRIAAGGVVETLRFVKK